MQTVIEGLNQFDLDEPAGDTTLVQEEFTSKDFKQDERNGFVIEMIHKFHN